MSIYEIIQILSDRNDLNDEKTGVSFYHYLVRTDGFIKKLEFLYTQKPEVRIFRDFNNLCMVDLIYEFPDDKDLLQQWLMLDNFFRPKNSCSYTDDEFDLFRQQEILEKAGEKVSEEEKVILEDHVLTLNIISLSPRGKYSLTSNSLPLFYMLLPRTPGEASTILRLVFQKDDVQFEALNDEASAKVYEEY